MRYKEYFTSVTCPVRTFTKFKCNILCENLVLYCKLNKQKIFYRNYKRFDINEHIRTIAYKELNKIKIILQLTLL